MQFLFPSDPVDQKRADETFAPELDAARAAGFVTSIFSSAQFDRGLLQAVPPIVPQDLVVYRGWMLSPSDYFVLAGRVAMAQARLLIDAQTYMATHYLPNWYAALAEFTPETHVFPLDADLESELRGLNWPAYFIKDYVKSVKTGGGSIITAPEQVHELKARMMKFRGRIEGGYCVRRVEEFVPVSEIRYFVFNSHPFAANGETPPEIVFECATRIRSPFYSVDVATRTDGTLRIIEIGDGQVSDLVGWTPTQFFSIFRDGPRP